MRKRRHRVLKATVGERLAGGQARDVSRMCTSPHPHLYMLWLGRRRGYPPGNAWPTDSRPAPTVPEAGALHGTSGGMPIARVRNAKPSAPPEVASADPTSRYRSSTAKLRM